MTTLQIQTPRAFVPLLAPSRYKGAHGGRGSGKSHFFGEMAVERCITQPGSRIVCVREVQKSLKESVKLLIEDKIRSLGVESLFRVLNDRIEATHNGLIVFAGMQDHTAESIKSLEGFDVAYVEEAQTLTSRSLEMLRPTIRKPGSELWFSWNPRHESDPVDALLRGPSAPPDARVVQVNYVDNPFFPAELESERAFDELHRPDRYAHVWLGEYEPRAAGALWDRITIHRNRRAEAPPMQRVLVAIDPPITNQPGSDECGIVVTGLGEDQRGYVLDDLSATGSPQEWGERAVAAYDLHEADAIVAEVNQGGDMVAHVIRTIRPSIRVIEVRATGSRRARTTGSAHGRVTGGKHVRAEPISSLYALDRISHVGAYPELEAQMCLMTAAGYEGDGSPDRLDAAVWGFTELFPRLTRRGQPAPGARPTRGALYNPHRAWSGRA